MIKRYPKYHCFFLLCSKETNFKKNQMILTIESETNTERKKHAITCNFFLCIGGCSISRVGIGVHSRVHPILHIRLLTY